MKKIATTSILISLCAILSLFDKMISNALFSSIPVFYSFAHTLRLGLANIVILFSIVKFDKKMTITIALMKSIVVGFIFGSPFTFAIGFLGTLFSLCTTIILYSCFNEAKVLPFISLCSGFAHMIGQIVMVLLLYHFNYLDLLLYAPILLLSSIISGTLIGLITKKILRIRIN